MYPLLIIICHLQALKSVSEIRDCVLVGLIRCGLGGGLAGSGLYPRLADTALGAGMETELAHQLEREGHIPLALALQVTNNTFSPRPFPNCIGMRGYE